AEGRNRTGTVTTHRRILSPVRLPIPPPRPNFQSDCSQSARSGSKSSKRTTGFEPATPTLARWCSTTELRPHVCRLKDLNPRPSDYKSDALPTELSRQHAINLH